MTKSDTTVELKLPIIENMELVATQTAEVVSKHMKLETDKTNEISLALIEACINAFEHSETKSEVYIHFIISEENLTIKVMSLLRGEDLNIHYILRIYQHLRTTLEHIIKGTQRAL